MLCHHVLSSRFLKARVATEPTCHMLMHILSKGGDLSSKPSAVILGLGNKKESLSIVSQLNYNSEMPGFQAFLRSFPPFLQRSSRRIVVYQRDQNFPRQENFQQDFLKKQNKTLHNINSIIQKTTWRGRKEGREKIRRGKNNGKDQILNEPIMIISGCPMNGAFHWFSIIFMLGWKSFLEKKNHVECFYKPHPVSMYFFVSTFLFTNINVSVIGACTRHFKSYSNYSWKTVII